MKRRVMLLAWAASLALLVTWAAAAAAAAQTPAEAAQAAAEKYLQVRSAAVLPGVGAGALAVCMPPGSRELVQEQLVAVGKRAFWCSWGERPVGVCSHVSVRESRCNAAGISATVTAYVYTTVTLKAADGDTRQEGEGINHVLTLEWQDDGWVVVTDHYLDTGDPAYLQAAHASASLVRASRRKLAHAARAAQLAALLGRPALCPPTALSCATPRYMDVITYDRADVVAYADKWTSESDSTGISHNGARYNPAYYDYASNGGPGDCTPYASQCIRAGGYPYLAGWYYAQNPFAASPSWYNNNPQRSYLTGRYLDRVNSVAGLQKGDLIYYDWNGDGVLDHTAVYVGIYNGVRCIDAHTSDHRHHAWNLGGTGTKYSFYSVRDSIHWPLPSQ